MLKRVWREAAQAGAETSSLFKMGKQGIPAGSPFPDVPLLIPTFDGEFASSFLPTRVTVVLLPGHVASVPAFRDEPQLYCTGWDGGRNRAKVLFSQS